MIRDLCKSQAFGKILVRLLPLPNNEATVTELETRVSTLQSGFGVFMGHLQHTRNTQDTGTICVLQLFSSTALQNVNNWSRIHKGVTYKKTKSACGQLAILKVYRTIC